MNGKCLQHKKNSVSGVYVYIIAAFKNRNVTSVLTYDS